MNKPRSGAYTFVTAIALLIGSASSHAHPNNDVIGSAGTAFLFEATGKSEFALPTLLLFNPAGCLVWIQLGLELQTWKSSFDAALSESPSCPAPQLTPAIERLISEGVGVSLSDTSGKHVLVWYGNDQLCAPCAQRKLDVLPAIKAALPDDTVTILLDWK
jgi:hypothetical protein